MQDVSDYFADTITVLNRDIRYKAMQKLANLFGIR
jgi:hypothetical protein